MARKTLETERQRRLREMENKPEYFQRNRNGELVRGGMIRDLLHEQLSALDRYERYAHIENVPIFVNKSRARLADAEKRLSETEYRNGAVYLDMQSTGNAIRIHSDTGIVCVRPLRSQRFEHLTLADRTVENDDVTDATKNTMRYLSIGNIEASSITIDGTKCPNLRVLIVHACDVDKLHVYNANELNVICIHRSSIAENVYDPREFRDGVAGIRFENLPNLRYVNAYDSSDEKYTFGPSLSGFQYVNTPRLLFGVFDGIDAMTDLTMDDWRPSVPSLSAYPALIRNVWTSQHTDLGNGSRHRYATAETRWVDASPECAFTLAPVSISTRKSDQDSAFDRQNWENSRVPIVVSRLTDESHFWASIKALLVEELDVTHYFITMVPALFLASMLKPFYPVLPDDDFELYEMFGVTYGKQISFAATFIDESTPADHPIRAYVSFYYNEPNDEHLEGIYVLPGFCAHGPVTSFGAGLEFNMITDIWTSHTLRGKGVGSRMVHHAMYQDNVPKKRPLIVNAYLDDAAMAFWLRMTPYPIITFAAWYFTNVIMRDELNALASRNADHDASEPLEDLYVIYGNDFVDDTKKLLDTHGFDLSKVSYDPTKSKLTKGTWPIDELIKYLSIVYVREDLAEKVVIKYDEPRKRQSTSAFVHVASQSHDITTPLRRSTRLKIGQ